MEIKKYLISFFSILFLLSVTVVAQEELSEDEWEAEMARLKDQKESLTNEVNSLQNEVNNLKATELQSYEDCMNELYAMVGATSSDVDNFRRAVNELDGKIRRKEGPKADRQKDLDALKINKVSALPEFFDKVHNQMQRSLDSWIEEVRETMYTVVRGDCLWNIAKKSEHYGNGFAWPMIYKANRDKIKNPDLIYPKQVFSIPKLTEEEKAKYDKIRRNYKPAPVQ
jgi:uncharacterized protein YoxC